MSEMLQKSVNLEPEAITKRDVSLAWLRFYFANEIPHSFDKYIAPSLMWALMPILKKLYKDKKDLSEAYQRHQYTDIVGWRYHNRNHGFPGGSSCAGGVYGYTRHN